MRSSFLSRAAHWLGLVSIVFGLMVSLTARAQSANGRAEAEPPAAADAASQPAQLEVLVFEDGRPVDDLIVRFGEAAGRTADGVWRAELPPASDRLTVFDHGQALTAMPLELRAGEIVQIIISLKGPERRAEVSIESSFGPGLTNLDERQSRQPAEAGSGTLTGRVVSTEDGAPIAGARVFVSGTPIEVRTGEQGRFSTEVPAGDYAVSVLHAEFATRTIENVAIAPDATTERNFELPPAGLELAEFVVVEPFIEGSLTEVVAIRRESTAVTDVLSAEQISRAGDSDVGAALKRVTGLTLVRGEFIFVRGLGERYSSVELNGATLPSPDPTRRVLPMDLFPADIVSRIVVQKTADAEMPAAFGGGNVQMTTRQFPEEFVFNVGYSTAYNSESTWQTARSYDGGDRDWTGFDDDTRDVPPLLDDATANGQFLRRASLFNPEGVSPEQLEAIGEQVAARTPFSTRNKELPADRGFGVTLGNSWTFGTGIQGGFLATVDYSDEWRFRDEQRRTFAATNEGLQPVNDLDVQRTLRNIDLSGFLTGGIEIGDWTSLGTNVMLLRKSEDETRFDEGIVDSQLLQRFKLEWTENQLFAAQWFGDHTVPGLGLNLDWQFTKGRATREDPNTVDWRRDDDDRDGVFVFSGRADGNSQSWAVLDEDLTDWSIDLRQPLPELGFAKIALKGGLGRTRRDRISILRTFSFDGRVPRDLVELPQEEIIAPENIGPRRLELGESTRATDNYTAEQELDTWFVMLETDLFDRLVMTGGLRHESNFQNVITDDFSNPDAPPQIGEIDDDDDLLSGSLTWRITDNAQLRLGYAETLSRPDFREISPAPFTDPQTDLRTVGNLDLETTSIENFDARFEYYFNEIDSFSFAYFTKDLSDPIEQVVTSGGSGTLVTLQNAESATVDGWEVDLYRSLGLVNDWQWLDRIRMGWLRGIGLEHFFIAANYTDLSTEINIDAETSNITNPTRRLQGASPWVVNAQIGYTSPREDLELTLLFNSFGERISRAGTQGQPDIFEEPF
ncbi:MAG: TonB-dependent receptor, partial [Wenzhouxiangellaceae bacterium]|nr:TonB-dependent receptor [Wenzhouxiangellaceae bacterium]